MLSFYYILFDRKISNSIRLFKNLEKKFGNLVYATFYVQNECMHVNLKKIKLSFL